MSRSTANGFILPPERQVLGTPLWGNESFPVTSNPQGSEQTVLPVSGTIQAMYVRWRERPSGEEVYRWIALRALELANLGEQRIGMKRLAEEARTQFRRVLNNSYVALIARDLLAEHPHLHGLIELRTRRST